MEHTNNSVSKRIENLTHLQFKIPIGKHIKIWHNFLIYFVFFSCRLGAFGYVYAIENKIEKYAMNFYAIW